MKCPLKFSRYEFEGGEDCIGAECGFYGSVCDATNGIADEITLPDGDVVSIMRDKPVVEICKIFDIDPNGRKHVNAMLNNLADMVERDYVLRSIFDAVCGERDEWKAKAESILNTESYKFASEPDAEIYTDCGKVEDDSRENGWYLRYDGYMTSKSNYLRISGFKAARALDNHQNLVFVKFMGGKEADCRVYAPKLDVFENLHDSSEETQKPRSKNPASENVSNSDGENLHVEQDSREKLESDIADSLCLFAHYAHDHYEHETVMQMVADRKNEFTAFLDRQATITRFQETSNQPNSGFVAQKQAETAENDTSKSEIRDFDDTREKLENDIWAGCDHLTMLERGHMLVNVPYDKLLGWLDRQVAITERECWPNLRDRFNEQFARANKLQAKVDELTAELNARQNPFADVLLDSLDSRKNELKLQEQVDELTKERDYWKQEVQYCMDAAYPKSHSPERRYDPNVMAYPDRKGCTTPSTLVCDIIDGLRDEKGEMYMGLVKELADIKDENAKLSGDELHWRSEAKRLEGELKTQRNNFDQATGARDYWKEKLGILLQRLRDMGCKVGSINDVPIEVELPREDEGLA